VGEIKKRNRESIRNSGREQSRGKWERRGGVRKLPPSISLEFSLLQSPIEKKFFYWKALKGGSPILSSNKWDPESENAKGRGGEQNRSLCGEITHGENCKL